MPGHIRSESQASVHVEASKRNTSQPHQVCILQNPLFPLVQPHLAFEHFFQQQRIQRHLVRAAADIGPKLCESVAHEDELTVEGKRMRETTLGPGLRTHIAD